MTTLTDRIEHLRQRATDLAAQLTSLSDKRREYSLAASAGDAKAVKAISDIDFQAEGLRREQATVGSAEECAEALERQAALEAQQRQQREKEIAAYSTARRIITLNEELDAMLKQLREAFERRAALLHELGSRGLVDHKLAGKGPATRAACHHGLHAHIALETCAPGSRMPLSDTNVLLFGIGKAPDKLVERVKLKERTA